MKKGLMRMVQSKLSAAFATWRHAAADMKQAAHTSSGAVRRMLNRKLSMAFEKWQVDAEEMRATQAAMKKGLMRMVQSKLSAAFATWRESKASRVELRRSWHQWLMG